jgi:hypothetical protein
VGDDKEPTMTDFDDLSDPEELPEEIVEWQPQHGPLIGRWGDAPVVIAATVGALAAMGLVAGAFLAGRASGRRLS